MPPTSPRMTEPTGEPPSDCQRRIGPLLAELRAALAHAAGLRDDAPDLDRTIADEEICLTSRSAYFDFYGWVMLNGEVDQSAEKELDHLFRRSLDLIHKPDLLESVRRRYKDFRKTCARTPAERLSSLAVSSIDS